MSKKDLFSILEKDHQDVKTQLETVISAFESGKKVNFSKLEKIKLALDVHCKIEEKYLYPEAEKVKEASNLVTDAYKEHEEVKTQLAEFKEDSSPDELQKYCQQILIGVEHHVKEEEGELFPILRQAWDDQKIQKLTEKAVELKEKEMASQE